jgi:hypothetical protein
MSMPLDPDAPRKIEALSTIERQLREAIARLSDVSARAARLADQTDWRTDAATRFHASADAWWHAVAGLSAHVEGASGDIARERARIEALTWGSAR